MTQLLVKLGGSFVQLVELLFQCARLIHDGRGFVVLSGLLERANLLAELVAAGFALFGKRDGLAAAFVEGTKISQQSSGIGAPRAQLFFNQLQVGTNES